MAGWKTVTLADGGAVVRPQIIQIPTTSDINNAAQSTSALSFPLPCRRSSADRLTRDLMEGRSGLISTGSKHQMAKGGPGRVWAGARKPQGLLSGAGAWVQLAGKMLS